MIKTQIKRSPGFWKCFSSLFLHICPFFFRCSSDSRDVWGDRWCHLSISGRPIGAADGPCHRFFASTRAPIYHHCSQPYQTNGDVKKERTEYRSDFLRLGTERFFCGAVSHLPSDVRRRNDTNCILPLWNTISGWRDGELIHLLAWSFKRGASILIWRDSSAPLLIRTKKSRSTGGGEPSDSKWSDL